MLKAPATSFSVAWLGTSFLINTTSLTLRLLCTPAMLISQKDVPLLLPSYRFERAFWVECPSPRSFQADIYISENHLQQEAFPDYTDSPAPDTCPPLSETDFMPSAQMLTQPLGLLPDRSAIAL